MEWEGVGVGRWRSVWDEGEKTCCRIGGGHLVAGVLHVRVCVGVCACVCVYECIAHPLPLHAEVLELEKSTHIYLVSQVGAL